MGSVVAVFLMFERWLWASGLMFYKKPGLKDIAYRVVGLFHAKIDEWLAIKGAWLHADWICKHWCLLISSLTSTHSFSVIYLHWLSSKHKVLERERERERERESMPNIITFLLASSFYKTATAYHFQFLSTLKSYRCNRG
jgi:hypothetical protein